LRISCIQHFKMAKKLPDIKRPSIFDISQEMTKVQTLREDFDPYAVANNLMEMDQLPNKVLLHIFSHLSHKEILKSARVCKKWRTLAYDSRLWKRVCLRPVYGGLQLLNLYFKNNAKWEMLILEYSWVSSMEALLALISARFGPSLTLMELQTDQITAPVLHELATKCPNLQYLTLDFSSATQLHDFADLQTFPARLHSLTICLSENIFLEGFLRKIYSFIGTVEVLHVIGTFEKWEEDEEEVYETINISKLKSHTPNLRVLNLWGIPFVTDEHIESISSSLPHLECLSVNFCQAVNGSSLKSLLQRCKRLRSLHMEQTTLDSKAVMNACWDNSVIEELNIAATDISSECLIYLLSRLSNLQEWIQSGNCSKLTALDLDNCDSLSEQSLIEFLNIYGEQLLGLNLGGNEKLLEQFWVSSLPKLSHLQILIMGIVEDCCPKVTAKIHIDQVIDCISQNIAKIKVLEIRWDSDKLRFSDKSSKFIDLLRMKCLQLQSLVIADGEYCEVVRSNFERADRGSVVRSSTHCQSTLAPLLAYFNDLMFN
ncbi:putative F-box/LRR-repeat protein, partial [Trichinella sp. T9]